MKQKLIDAINAVKEACKYGLSWRREMWWS